MWFVCYPPEGAMLHVLCLVYLYTAAQAYVINAVIDKDDYEERKC